MRPRRMYNEVEGIVENSRTVAILGAARTPIGRLVGSLSGVEATALGATAIGGALERSGADPADVDYAIMGNVLGAGLGQAPARQAAVGGGLPYTCPALTVNKVCASGLMATVLAAQMIQTGDASVAVAGGMESMSRAPHILKGGRSPKKLGNLELTDTMIDDGLWCCFNDRPMGDLAEGTATAFEVNREEQDRFAVASHHKAILAAETGAFSSEIVPVTVNGRKGPTTVDVDEGPRADASLESLSKLRPAFSPANSVTPGNSSQISDGAAAVVVSSPERAAELGLEPIAMIDDYVFVADDPARLFETPAMAVDRLLKKGGLTLADIDILEVNEAFAAQVLANGRALDWDPDKINVNGGGVALGHPIGASGARILVTLIHAMKQRGLGTGVAALCHGGGGGVAMRVSLV